MGAWIEIIWFSLSSLIDESLLSWERGLKSTGGTAGAISLASLLSWERGLKSIQVDLRRASDSVAPLVGAWIEIGDMYNITDQFTVAPLVGAWIEIVLVHGL